MTLAPEDLIEAAGLSGWPRTLSIEQYAQAVGISRSAAYEAVRRGEVPTVRCGSLKRVPRFAVSHYLVFHTWPSSAET